MARARTRSTFAFGTGYISLLPQFFSSGDRCLVGDIEEIVLNVYGEPDVGHLLNHMHDVGGIGMVPHRILTSIKYLVTNVLADGELLKIITKAPKHLLRIIMKEGGVTSLRIHDLS